MSSGKAPTVKHPANAACEDEGQPASEAAAASPTDEAGSGAGADPQSYRLEEQAGHLIRRAHQRASALFQELIGDGQVTPTQWAALVKLYDQGESSQNQLGRLTAMDPATIQGVIRRLHDRHLIVSRSDPADRRRTLLSLSPQGVAVVQRLLPNGPVVTRAILEPLTADEQEVFVDLLRRLC